MNQLNGWHHTIDAKKVEWVKTFEKNEWIDRWIDRYDGYNLYQISNMQKMAI